MVCSRSGVENRRVVILTAGKTMFALRAGNGEIIRRVKFCLRISGFGCILITKVRQVYQSSWERKLGKIMAIHIVKRFDRQKV